MSKIPFFIRSETFTLFYKKVISFLTPAQKVFTDGSRRQNGKAGYGIWYGPGHERNIGQPICPKKHGVLTSRQVEDFAIYKALLRESRRKEIPPKLIIYTDSAASIRLLVLPKPKLSPKDKYIIQSAYLVKTLEQKGCRTIFRYVRGHSQIEGNVGAHKLAYQAAKRLPQSQITNSKSAEPFKSSEPSKSSKSSKSVESSKSLKSAEPSKSLKSTESSKSSKTSKSTGLLKPLQPSEPFKNQTL